MDATTDPALRSFVPVAPESHFPIQNLPLGIFQRDENSLPTIGVAIGDFVLDLAALAAQGYLAIEGLAADFFSQQRTLNEFLRRGPQVWRALRERVSYLLRHETSDLRDRPHLRDAVLIPQTQVQMLLPAIIENYTDFYSSREHATNVGIMLRGPQNALMPNWVHLPVAYHGRASSVVISGTPIHRPLGQTRPDDQAPPIFGPSRNLDFELEMGFLIGPGNDLGRPIPIGKAADHIFGMVLVNDWSARDLQKWEYQPLGPFLAKNFATSISPWVVPLVALEPFRTPGPKQDPEPFPYLRSPRDWAFDIQLEVQLQTATMKQPETISRSNSKYLYWNILQQLAHHTINGCNMRPGDLLASGTISGPTPDSLGSMLELAWKGTRPVPLANGESRTFLQEGDTVTMTGWCQGQGYRIGFGEVTGKILPTVSGLTP